VIVEALEGDYPISRDVLENWVSDKRHLMAGLGFATVNTSIAHSLGVPAVFQTDPLALTVIHVGFFLAGFSAGIGLLAIIAVIALYLKLAPNLHYSLDANNPDGNGGIKKLGDSLWFFAMLIGAVAVLVSIYMFGVRWVYIYKPHMQLIFILWVALPYLAAISVVLIPGLVVRRQVMSFKNYRSEQLNKEKAEAYSAFKQFSEKTDDEIIDEKKELSKKLNSIQDELKKLKKMRNSHLDGN